MYFDTPLFTKKTKTTNNAFISQVQNERDFFRPINTSPSILIGPSNHEMDAGRRDTSGWKGEAVTIDRLNFSNERFSSATRNSNTEHVQSKIQHSDYYMTNFFNERPMISEGPIDSHYSQVKKERNIQRGEFLSFQGASMKDNEFQNTRVNKKDLNTGGYIPLGRSMPIPKENV